VEFPLTADVVRGLSWVYLPVGKTHGLVRTPGPRPYRFSLCCTSIPGLPSRR